MLSLQFASKPSSLLSRNLNVAVLIFEEWKMSILTFICLFKHFKPLF